MKFNKEANSALAWFQLYYPHSSLVP